MARKTKAQRHREKEVPGKIIADSANARAFAAERNRAQLKALCKDGFMTMEIAQPSGLIVTRRMYRRFGMGRPSPTIQSCNGT